MKLTVIECGAASAPGVSREYETPGDPPEPKSEEQILRDYYDFLSRLSDGDRAILKARIDLVVNRISPPSQ